jgi:hypothetical protein
MPSSSAKDSPEAEGSNTLDLAANSVPVPSPQRATAGLTVVPLTRSEEVKRLQARGRKAAQDAQDYLDQLKEVTHAYM